MTRLLTVIFCILSVCGNLLADPAEAFQVKLASKDGVISRHKGIRHWKVRNGKPASESSPDYQEQKTFRSKSWAPRTSTSITKTS